MENNISKIVRNLAKNYQEENKCTLWQINNGLCVEFAEDLLDQLGGYGPETYELHTDNFFNLMGDKGSTAAFKDENGKYYFENYGVFPSDLDPDGFYDVGVHVWLYHQGKHYDAEAPNGVTNFLDLPLFKRAINRYRRKRLDKPKPDFFAHKKIQEGLNLPKKQSVSLDNAEEGDQLLCYNYYTPEERLKYNTNWDLPEFTVGKYYKVLGVFNDSTIVFGDDNNKKHTLKVNQMLPGPKGGHLMSDFFKLFKSSDNLSEGLNLPKKSPPSYRSKKPDELGVIRLDSAQEALDALMDGHEVMVKGYGDDWENYTGIYKEDYEDMDNDEILDLLADYEDYQLWGVPPLNEGLNLANLNENRNSKLTQITPNKYVYHTSNPIFRDKISKQGLIPKGKSEAWLSDTKIDGKAIFAVNSDDKEDWWDSTYDDDIYQIDTEKITNKWFEDPNFSNDKEQFAVYNGKPIKLPNTTKKNDRIITFEKIPIEAIELIYKGAGTDLLEGLNIPKKKNYQDITRDNVIRGDKVICVRNYGVFKRGKQYTVHSLSPYAIKLLYKKHDGQLITYTIMDNDLNTYFALPLSEGLNLMKKKQPDWRYFEVRICPWGWTDDDECDGDWDFIYFKLKGEDIMEISQLFGPHDIDDAYVILRTAILNNVLEKRYYDQASEAVELTRDEYCDMTDCDEDDLMEGLNLPKKAYYPYATITKMANELLGKYRKQILEQGWYIFSSDRTPEFEEIHGTSKDGYYLVVEKIDAPEIFDGELPVGILHNDLEAYSFARALGIMITDDGIIYGFNGEKVKPTIHEGLNIPKKKKEFTYEDIKSQFNLLVAEKSSVEKRITHDYPTSSNPFIMLQMYDILGDGNWLVDILWEGNWPNELRLFLVSIDEEGYTETEGTMEVKITSMDSFTHDLESAINHITRNHGLISEGLNLPKKETMDRVELPNVMDKEQKRYAKIGYRVGWIDAGKFRYGTVYQIFRLPGQEVVVVIQPDDIGNTSSIELPVSQLIAGAVL